MLSLELLYANFHNTPSLLSQGHGYFSQAGEDIVIDSLLLNETTKGIFVDIGAYHPFRFSNTFLLYLQGWRGVNVDANAESIEMFKSVRPQDTSISALVSDRVDTMQYYAFLEGAWNTTSELAAKYLEDRGDPEGKLVRTTTMTTTPINEILDTYVNNLKFDLLTIDIEGDDEKVFTSINFKKYRPKVICIELPPEKFYCEPMSSFLKQIGYKHHSQCCHSAILARETN